jgi:hypothetical protein
MGCCADDGGDDADDVHYLNFLCEDWNSGRAEVVFLVS